MRDTKGNWLSGTPVKLTVSATGFDPGADVKFEIFDSCRTSGAALDDVTGKTPDDVDNHVVEVSWTPDAQKLKDVSSGSLAFVASAGGLKTVSAPARISIMHSFDIKDADGNPLTAGGEVLFFSGGGKVKTTTVESVNGKAEVKARLGATLLYAHLTQHNGQMAKFTEGGSSQSFRGTLPDPGERERIIMDPLTGLQQ